MSSLETREWERHQKACLWLSLQTTHHAQTHWAPNLLVLPRASPSLHPPLPTSSSLCSADVNPSCLSRARFCAASPPRPHLAHPAFSVLSKLGQRCPSALQSTVYLFFKNCVYLSFSPSLNFTFLGKIKFHPQPSLWCLTRIRCFQPIKINKNKNSLPK